MFAVIMQFYVCSWDVTLCSQLECYLTFAVGMIYYAGSANVFVVFSPEKKGLSSDELEALGGVRTYQEKRDEDHECRICLSRIESGEEIRTLLCGHFGHKKCYDTWLKNAKTCPICRRNVLEDH